MTSILVTGATGFLGRYVVRRLVADGLSVHGVSRSGGDVDGLTVDALDLTDGHAYLEWRDGKSFDAVVHLAADIPGRPAATPGDRDSDAERMLIANTAMTLHALALADLPESHIIYASGASVYGSAPDTAPADEETPPNPGNLYVAAKYVGEVLCRQRTAGDGLVSTVLRISSPCGPGQKRDTVMRTFIKSAIEGRDLIVYGDGRRTQDFIFAEDVAEAVLQALRRRAEGVFNIASGVPVSMMQLAEAVLAVVGGKSRIVPGPPDPQEDYRASISIAKARRELDWSPRVSLEEGLRRTVEAMRRA